MRCKAAILIAALLVAMPTTAEAEPQQMPSAHLWMRSAPGVLHINGLMYDIPQGSHIITGSEWDLLEIEKKRLQEQEIRLKAENDSFRESADEVPWRLIALGVAVGLITGTYIGLKF